MPFLNKKLFLFTAEFPFGLKSETFLETELPYLASAFEEVIIFPGSRGNENVRSLPANVKIDESIVSPDFSGKKKWKALFRNFGLVVKVICGELSFKKLFSFLICIKSLLDYLAQQIIIMEILEKKVKTEKDAFFYDYWFIDSTLALSMLKAKGSISSFVARAHRFDLYDDQNISYGVPFRKWKMKMIDKLFLISSHGLEYAKKKTENKYRNKLILSNLGVIAPHEYPIEVKNKIPVIVSCSRMEEFKQVHNIPKVLQHVSFPVRWIHFGDGPMMEEVQVAVKKLPSHISYELKGLRSNTEVLQFYKENYVDLFLSLSLSEGLPVSMMEAQSFGIPVVAFPVGGVPELLVSQSTGVMLKMGATEKEIAEIITGLLDHPLDRIMIRQFFNEHFNAGINYSKFVESLNGL